MKRNQERGAAEGYCIQVLIINGEVQNHLSHKSFYIENIGKGGFRFISDVNFELEDRVQVLLRFPDDHTQEVLGRICYSDSLDDDTKAYGFSVIDGFYSLLASGG
ncbi:MAG: PilZ domain-containing protein [Proteobacteria bacterium]|nr:PilZ domain-containing protein [Pseudomonadota bacterium]